MGTEYKDDDDLTAVRARLSERASLLGEQIKPLQIELSRIRAQLDLVERAIALTGEDEHSLPDDRTISAKSNIADRIAEILRETGHELHVTEIRNRYLAKNFTVPGQGRDSNLLVYIVRDSRFVRVSKGTYTLAEAVSPSDSLPSRIPAKSRVKRRRRKKKS